MFHCKISCARTTFEVSAEGAKEEQGHVLKLKPFMVDMLDVVAVEGLGSGVECWMDIQKGVFPNVSCSHTGDGYRICSKFFLRLPQISFILRFFLLKHIGRFLLIYYCFL